MLQNAYLLARIGADTAENDRTFAEILPKNGNYPTGPLPYGLTLVGAHRAGLSGRGRRLEWRGPGLLEHWDLEQEDESAKLAKLANFENFCKIL